MIDRSEEYDRMAISEKELWWYRILHTRVIKELNGVFKGKPDPEILDAGCGTGGLITRLTEAGYSRVSGFDLSDDALRICRNKGINNLTKGNIINIKDHYSPGSFDAIICNDVLCYPVGDQVAETLSQMLGLLKKDGILIINLPAMKAFSGIHDISVGIVKRWTKKEFEQVIKGFPFKSVQYEYWPFLLSPFIFFIRIYQRILLKMRPDVTIESDVSVPAAPVNKLLFLISYFEYKYIRKLSPAGSSLFVVMKT